MDYFLFRLQLILTPPSFFKYFSVSISVNREYEVKIHSILIFVKEFEFFTYIFLQFTSLLLTMNYLLLTIGFFIHKFLSFLTFIGLFTQIYPF